MITEHPSNEHLQRSFDGDLPKAEAASVRAHVAGCTQCQSELDSLRRLGDLVRLAAQPRTDSDAAFARMFANIESALEASPTNSKNSTNATPQAHGAPARARGTATPAAPARVRLVYRAAPALGAVALAAAALLMVYRPDAPSELDEAPYEAVASVAHSEIVEVDFGNNAGTVFDIPLADGSSIPVVWIDDDDDEE